MVLGMPFTALDAALQSRVLHNASSDLKWLLSDNNVPVEVQAVIFNLGFDRMRIFAGLGESRTEVRDFLRVDVGLDAADGAQSRAQVAMVLATWDAAKATIENELKTKAEYKAAEIARPVPHQELALLRSAFETRFYKLESRLVPSKAYLGTKQEEIDENEPRAESLKDVSSREDTESTFLSADVTAEGMLKVRKGVREGSMPTDSEGLRTKHKLMGHCWIFLRLKHTNRHWLSDVTDRTFPAFSDYLLGKHVFGVLITATSGKTHHPPWSLVLSYEHEVRKRAYELVVEGETMGAAIQAVCDDAGHRERYFLSPFCLGASSSTTPLPSPSPSLPTHISNKALKKVVRKLKYNKPFPTDFPAFAKGRGRGRGRGRGKGSGKGSGGNTKVLHQGGFRYTDDGQEICFKYNDGEACKDCKRAHICTGCKGKHPRHECRS